MINEFILADGQVNQAAISLEFGQCAANEKWVICTLSDEYIVSNYGRIIRLPHDVHYRCKSAWVDLHRSARLLDPSGTSGYKEVLLYLNNKPKYVTIHRLVALAFLSNPENKPTVNHKDGNKLNNYVGNLEWATYQENNKHAILTGLRNSVRPVKCLENGVVYESCAHASRELGVWEDVVKSSIVRQYTTYKGYTFVYADEFTGDEKEYLANLHARRASLSNPNRDRVPVVCLDTGDEFASLSEAGRWIGVSYSSINSAIHNQVACKGHVFVKTDNVPTDVQGYIDYCYTRSRFYKHLASRPVNHLK